MKIKIKSITDVITNSSTEVFTIVDEDSINTVKEMVDNIFAMCNYPHKFDDIFDVELDIETDCLEDFYEEWLIENEPSKLLEWNNLDWRGKAKVIDNLDYNTLVEVAKRHDKKAAEWGEGSNAIYGMSVVVKPNIDIENIDVVKKVAKYLSKIDSIFESEVRSC